MNSYKPLLSVVIPTAYRPQWLPRAVESALSGMASKDIEVIVVPNGSDQSWRESLAPYANNPSVRVIPISKANVNVARNTGMANARGKFIRFLDDDDFLIQPGAMEQVLLLERTGGEVCSGQVLNVDKDLTPLGMLTVPDTQDFVEASLTLSGFRLPVGNVYRRETLVSISANWRCDVSRGEDLVWMLDLSSLKEWRWQHLPKPVGTWFQHEAERVSTVRLREDKPTKVIDILFGLYEKLKSSDRLTEGRTQAWSRLLWHYIHWRIPYDIAYWTRVAYRLANVAPLSRPEHAIFEKSVFKYMNPVFAEFILAFPRKFTTWRRDRMRDRSGWDYRRWL